MTDLSLCAALCCSALYCLVSALFERAHVERSLSSVISAVTSALTSALTSLTPLSEGGRLSLLISHHTAPLASLQEVSP